MNSYYQNWRNYLNERRANTSKERSYGEQMALAAFGFQVGKFLIHVLSFSAAILLPAYAFEVLFGNFYLGLAVGAALFLVLIELPKYAVINTIFENYHEYGYYSGGAALGAFILIAFSVVSSTFGVPIMVDRLAPTPELVDLVKIEQRYDSLKNKAIAYWSNLKNEVEGKSQVILQGGSRKNGTYIKSTALKQNASLLGSSLSYTDSLNSALSVLSYELKSALKTATNENNKTIRWHNTKKRDVGFISMLVMLLLEVAYLGVVAYLKYYDHRREKELGTDTVKDNRTTSNNTNSVHLGGTGTDTLATAKQKPIGFNNNKRTCVVCSVDISHKRADAKVCSATCRKIKNQC